MTGEGTEQKDREHFIGLVMFLRHLATQLLEQKQTEEARELIDAIQALEAKTQGNLDEEEQKLLAGVLYDLRMTAVTGTGAAPGPEDGKSE